MGETLRLLKEKNMDPEEILFSPENLAKLIPVPDLLYPLVTDVDGDKIGIREISVILRVLPLGQGSGCSGIWHAHGDEEPQLVPCDHTPGVLLHVDLMDPYGLFPRRSLDLHMTVPADRQVELADLVILRVIGIKIILPVKLTILRDFTVCRKSHSQRIIRSVKNVSW